MKSADQILFGPSGGDGMDAPHGFAMSHTEVLKTFQKEETSMTKITTVGLDLAKSVFQVHAADALGRPVMRRKLRRGGVKPNWLDWISGPA